MKDCLKVVVTGDVDAGKSTLIGRFLYESGSLSRGVLEDVGDTCQRLDSDFEFAYLLDSFEEERKGQLTIDTTQVFCKTKKGKEFVFIDVPGHKELIRNMLCGSSYADIAVLVVDMGKPIGDQTKRHAVILKFLGIQHVITVFNKMDAVGFDERPFKDACESAAGLLRNIDIVSGHGIPVSAKKGENLLSISQSMDWYRGPALIDALNSYSPKIITGDFRFPVQDIYDVEGDTIAVGRIISGVIKKGDAVRILPLDQERTVRTIRVFKKSLWRAETPMSVGLTLDDMRGLMRGTIICKPPLPQVSTEFRSKLLCLQSLDQGEKLLLRCATQETAAEIKQMNRISGIDSDVALALIATEGPVVTEDFSGYNGLGRFVLQRNGAMCAVGTIGAR
jgi:bifunctional enzyme CysN/CysC